MSKMSLFLILSVASLKGYATSHQLEFRTQKNCVPANDQLHAFDCLTSMPDGSVKKFRHLQVSHIKKDAFVVGKPQPPTLDQLLSIAPQPEI